MWFGREMYEIDGRDSYKMTHDKIPEFVVDNVGPPGRPKRNKNKTKAARRARKLNC